MTLDDARIERYSRQIVLDGVGARGQIRLLRARVTVAGDGAAALAAATLLGRAGVGALDLVGCPMLPETSPDCRVTRDDEASHAAAADVVVDLGGDARLTERLGRTRRPLVLGTRHGEALRVATLVGRPCAACLAVDPLAGAGGGTLDAVALPALGALAAGEALVVLLAPPAAGRLQSVDLDTGKVGSTTLGPTTGCAVCGGGA